jgi:thermitase
MGLRKQFLTWVLVLAGLIAGGGAFGGEFAEDELLVKFRPGTPGQVRAAAHRMHGGTVRERIEGLDVEVVTVPRGLVRARQAVYEHNPNVLYAEPNFIAEATVTPSDAYFSRQWGLATVRAPQAWDVTHGSSGVKIAILDTGIDLNHPDLQAKVVVNKNFTSSSTVDDQNGHGTHCAGIAAAVTNNAAGVAGLGYNCSLMNVKVLGSDGSGYYNWMANGIIWATNNGAKVISMSLGAPWSSQTLRDALQYAWNSGVVIVAAAGNSGTNAPTYPAYYDMCIAVAATDPYDRKPSWSNWGTWVDVTAPGVGIFSTLPNHANQIGLLNYGSLSGTSMATPCVAGLAGLIWSRAPYNGSNSSVRSRLESTCSAIAGTGSLWARGRIDAYRAVQ